MDHSRYKYKIEYSHNSKRWHVIPVKGGSRYCDAGKRFDSRASAEKYMDEVIQAEHDDKRAAHDAQRLILDTACLIIRHRFTGEIHVGTVWRMFGESVTRAAINKLCHEGRAVPINKTRWRLT